MVILMNTAATSAAFTVSVDAYARFGVTSGISVWDRTTTIHVAVDPDATPGDLVRPGHVFPLRARPGGLAVRQSHTEAAGELARLAGLLVEILRRDGGAARRPDLLAFCHEHGLLFTTIGALVEYAGVALPCAMAS